MVYKYRDLQKRETLPTVLYPPLGQNCHPELFQANASCTPVPREADTGRSKRQQGSQWALMATMRTSVARSGLLSL